MLVGEWRCEIPAFAGMTALGKREIRLKPAFHVAASRGSMPAEFFADKSLDLQGFPLSLRPYFDPDPFAWRA